VDRFDIGAVRVHRIEEWRGNFAPPEHLLAGCTPEAFAPYAERFSPGYYDLQERKLFAFLQSWVLEVDGLRILFDTGAGNDKERSGIPVFGNLSTDFLGNLRRAGFAPEDIDVVVCSHLHIDHVGWNTVLREGRWEPTFPNARYLLPAVDEEFWNPANAAQFPEQVGRAVNSGVYEDSVAPVIAAGMAELVQPGHRVAEGITLEAAPGHTPGQMVMHVSSRGEHALFVGDVLHHPVQVHHPEWNSVFCENPEQSRATRRAVLAKAADLDALLVPAHFGGQHVCRVRRLGDGFVPEFPT
jgi:glyoxylase-like metal-dependent hydrolase (beta-lactamase superfamily II)